MSIRTRTSGIMIPAWVLPAAGADSAAFTNFIARTSGLDAAHISAYQTLLNGLTTDGFFDGSGNSSLFDCLYILATQDTTTAHLNLVNSSFTLVDNGTITFAADQGLTGGGSGLSNDFVKTNYNPTTNGTNFTVNSGSLAVYVRTNTTTGADMTDIGSAAAFFNLITPKDAAGNLGWGVSLNAGENAVANTNVQGFWIATRTGANTSAIYKNGNTTPIQTDNVNGAGLENAEQGLLARGPSGSSFNSTHQIAAAFFGGGLSAADMAAVAARINAFLTTVGANVY